MTKGSSHIGGVPAHRSGAHAAGRVRHQFGGAS
jgi:hypothetical protein